MLAERTIKAAKSIEKDVFLSDGKGLYVRVHPSGRKSFVYKDQRGGKTKWISLGNYPDVTLAEARERAEKIRSGSIVQADKTVRWLVDTYYEYVKTVYKRPALVYERLEPNIAEPLGKTRLVNLTRQDFTARFDEITKRGSPVMANRVMEETKKMLFFAQEKGWIKDNPLLGVTRRVVGGKESSRDVTLTDAEIETFFDDARNAKGMAPGTSWVLYFSLLTGCRVAEAEWCLRNKTREIPLEICKYRTHTLPNTPGIRAALKLVGSDISKSTSLNSTLRRIGRRYTPHDLRRTFASRLGDAGVMPHVIEKLLNHKMTGVMGVYNRAEFWRERTEAQLLWESILRNFRRKKSGGA